MIKHVINNIVGELVALKLVKQSNIYIGSPDGWLKEKQEFYPSVNIDFNTGQVNDQEVSMSFSIDIVDLVDDSFGGDDETNETDVLDTTLFICGAITSFLQTTQLDGASRLETSAEVTRVYPEESTPANVGGWNLSFPLMIQNTAHEA